MTTWRHQPLAPRYGPPDPDPNPSGRKSQITKSTRACDKCRALRKKCNGARPCPRCQSLQTECTYSGFDRRSRENFRAQIQALQQRNAYLEQLVRQLSCNQADAAVQQPVPFIDHGILAGARGPGLQQGVQESLRTEVGGSASATASASTSILTGSSGTPAVLQPSMPMQIPSGEMELEHMFYAATATAATATMTQPLPGSREPRAGYTYCGEGRGPDRLPEKRITQQALDAFFQCAATLFYVMTAEKATQLLERVYHDDNASAQDLCELCALAAIGSSYKVDEIPGEARAVYFYLASTGLNEAIEADAIQGMRIFICLCMSSIMDKSSSARLLIVSALNLARGKMEADLQKGGANERDTEEDEYRRTLQTLVFLEGWLSYSLGYRNCLKKSEIDLVHYTIPLTTSPTTASSSALTTRLIQSHMTKLTLLASGSQDEIAAHGATYWSHADTLSSRLNTWHHNLPPDLHLDALTRDDGKRSVTILQERALYLMHILYIDMRLQLHCQLIKASYVSHRGPEADENFIERLFAQVPSQTLDAHMTFAVQLAGIVSLLFRETATMTRCWLVIRSVFDACIVLLFSACRRYASSPSEQIDSMGDIFTHVDTCLTVLTFCSRRDIVAHRLFEALDSVFRDLSRLTDTEMNNPPGQGGSNLNASGGGTQGSLSTSREMCIQYIVDDACAEQVPRRKALVGVMVRLLDLMSPGGNFWV